MSAGGSGSSPMRTRALKRILTAIGALCVLGTAGAFAAACGAYRVIDARGSSSVQPFLNALAQAYTNPENYPDRKIEISVQAGGSALGITSAANGQTMIGTASKSPYDSVSSDPSLLEA